MFKATVVTLAALLMLGAATSEAQVPKRDGKSAQMNDGDARIVDQLERLVRRPNPITLTPVQRKQLDSLEVRYLKEARALEAGSGTSDRMGQVMKARDMQKRYQDAIRKLLTPLQLTDFETNVEASMHRGSLQSAAET